MDAWPYYLQEDIKFIKHDCICEPCRPVLMHQEAVTCGFTIEATNLVAGSSAYNAITCNSGQKMCFNDSTTITFTGTQALIFDSIIIYGHNMITGSLSVSPHQLFGGPADLDYGPSCVCGVDDCPPTIVKDIVIPPIGSAVNQVVVEIQSQGLICIDRIFLAKKMPIDFRANTFENPFDGTDQESDSKESSCGTLITSTKRTKVPLSLDIPCVPVSYVDNEWKCYLKWAAKHGVWFRPCINTYPNDVFVGTLNDKQTPSKFADKGRCTKNLQLTATGHISPPPCKTSA